MAKHKRVKETQSMLNYAVALAEEFDRYDDYLKACRDQGVKPLPPESVKGALGKKRTHRKG